MTAVDQLQDDFKEALVCFFIYAVFSAAMFCIFIHMIIKAKKCAHNNKVTRTFWVTTVCEQTADFCSDCGKQLSETKIDCR